MTAPFKACCLQPTPGNDLEENLLGVLSLIAGAARGGATLVALPEFATYLDRDSRSMRSAASAQADSPALERLRQAAQQHEIWLLIGSLVILGDGAEGKLSNRSFLVAPDGTVAGEYDKIHLFDARLADGRVVGESKHYRGGNHAVVVETPIGRIGMSVCYDVRFPHLYRELALAGAEILMIPAAFTAETGAAHWDTLLRARAIETGCFILAPATTGMHPGNWQTYGHAAIIDPWGTVLAQCGNEPDTSCEATIDLDEVAKVRARIPSLTTNPEFTVTTSRFQG